MMLTAIHTKDSRSAAFLKGEEAIVVNLNDTALSFPAEQKVRLLAQLVDSRYPAVACRGKCILQLAEGGDSAEVNDGGVVSVDSNVHNPYSFPALWPFGLSGQDNG